MRRTNWTNSHDYHSHLSGYIVCRANLYKIWHGQERHNRFPSERSPSDNYLFGQWCNNEILNGVIKQDFLDLKSCCFSLKSCISDTIQEFMLATNLSEAESTETKLRMAFKIYDKDSSGDLTNYYNDCI